MAYKGKQRRAEAEQNLAKLEEARDLILATEKTLGVAKRRLNSAHRNGNVAEKDFMWRSIKDLDVITQDLIAIRNEVEDEMHNENYTIQEFVEMEKNGEAEK